LSSPQHKTIHCKGMEVVANVIETCANEAVQSCTHGYLEPVEGFGENAKREMLNVQNNF